MAVELNNKQLYEKNSNLLDAQEDLFDEIIDQAVESKHHANMINEELKNQDKLIDRLSDGMTDNLYNLGKSGKKLDEIIKRASFCK